MLLPFDAHQAPLSLLPRALDVLGLPLGLSLGCELQLLLLGCQGGLELLQCLVHEIMEQYALLFNTLLDVHDLQVIQGPILVGCSAFCWTRMLLLR